jgi:hypothetical protein
MFKGYIGTVYRKWFVLAVLSGCIYVFGYSDGSGVQHVAAAPCYEECEDHLDECRDACFGNCNPDSGDQSCNSCIGTCSSQYLNCLGYAVSCENELRTYSPACSVIFGKHCEDFFCVTYHQGYYQECTILGQQCLNCPNNEFCDNPNSLNPCP